MTGTHTRVHVTDYMWLIAAYLWTNSTSAGFTWSCVCLIVLTFQYTACLLQRLSPCPLWGRHVETVTELLLVYCLKKTVRRFMARDGSLITSVCVTKSCLHVSLPAQCVSEGKTKALEGGQPSFQCHSSRSVCIGDSGCFSQVNTPPSWTNQQGGQRSPLYQLCKGTYLIFGNCCNKHLEAFTS